MRSPSSSITAGRLSADDWDNQMLFFLAQRLSRDRARSPRPRALQPEPGRARHGHLRRRRRRAHRRARPEERHPHRPLDRRWRGRALRGARQAGPRRQDSCWSGPCRRSWSSRRAIPAALPIDVFDGLRATLAANRAQFYIDFPSGPFYGFNRPGAKPNQGLIDNWWRQGMMGARQRPLRMHQGVLGNRLHRGPEGRSTVPVARRARQRTTRSCRSPTRRCCRSSC